jgi:hypothetical protein
MGIESIREELNTFFEESSREWYESGAGLKDEVHMAAIYERHPELFKFENVKEAASALEKAEASGDADEIRRLRELRAALTAGFIREDLKELTDQATNLESGAKVKTVDGEEIPYRESAVRLLNEVDRDNRAILEAARMEVVAQKNEILAPIHMRTHELAEKIGYAGYLDMMNGVKSFPLGPVREEMQSFLRETDALYESHLNEAIRQELGLNPKEVQRHDLAHLFRGSGYDDLFPQDRIVPAARECCASMGLDLEAEGRVHLDLEARPRKSPRAFCASVRVPEEVYLVIFPRGGHDDYHAFLHELGHALHFAYVDPKATMEAKQLGDNSVTEGYAMLFDHLLLDPEWLSDLQGGAENYRAFLHHHALFELFMLRRYAAKIDYELALHAGPGLSGKDALYARTLGEATRATYPEASYLDDVDGFFYCANYLRAWMLQAQIGEALMTRFGRRWWRAEGAGAFLFDLWRMGQAENGDEVSARLGFDRLETGPLIERIEALLKG